MTDPDLKVRNRRSALRLMLVVVGMFGFGYALVPLYEVFCQVTGINGRTGVVEARQLDGEVDRTRLVTVEFTGIVNSSLPWDLEPETLRMQVHPGEVYETHYVARNRSDRRTTGQAVPSVAPNVASLYFNKTECFCFTRQTFDGGESREMPVRFVLSRNLPPDIRTVTLSYTFFELDEKG